MKSFISCIALILISAFLLFGCQQTTLPEEQEIIVSVTVDYEHLMILSVTSPHEVTITDHDSTYQVTVTLGVQLATYDVRVFKVNGSIISPDDYSFLDGVITYITDKTIDPIVPVTVNFDLVGGMLLLV